MGNIVRAGFNDPDELVDGVTYVNNAEPPTAASKSISLDSVGVLTGTATTPTATPSVATRAGATTRAGQKPATSVVL